MTTSWLSAVEIQEGVKAGEISAMGVAAAVAARIEARQGEIQAYAYYDRATFIESARRADLEVAGPLHGVTLAVKDTILTKDMPTEHNTARYRGRMPGVDAACVDTLRAAGALVVGKTVTTELAATTRGASTRNPLDPRYSPGGSSSGSAAAVSDGQATIGIGSQTGGSLVRPASYCGVFGWKPTWGAISNEGIKVYAPSCDTVGFFARSADDLRLLAQVFSLHQGKPGTPDEGAAPRIAICETPFWHYASEATKGALSTATRLIQAAGGEVQTLELSGRFSELDSARRCIVGHEGSVSLLNEARNTPSLHAELLDVVATGSALDSESLRSAYRVADSCRAEFDCIAEEWDAVLAPSAVGEPPLGLEWTGDSSFNSLWSILHVPVVNVPGLFGPARLPVGLSLIARRHEDVGLLSIAGWLGRLLGAQLSRDVAATKNPTP